MVASWSKTTSKLESSSWVARVHGGVHQMGSRPMEEWCFSLLTNMATFDQSWGCMQKELGQVRLSDPIFFRRTISCKKKLGSVWITCRALQLCVGIGHWLLDGVLQAVGGCDSTEQHQKLLTPRHYTSWLQDTEPTPCLWNHCFWMFWYCFYYPPQVLLVKLLDSDPLARRTVEVWHH